MAINQVQTVATPRSWVKQVTVANAGRDGTGTTQTLVPIGSADSPTSSTTRIIERIWAQATVTTTIGAIRLFLNDGSNTRLCEEIDVDAVTVGPSDPAWTGQSSRCTPQTPLKLPTGWSLLVSTDKGEAINVFADGGDL